jgi:hemoglobin
MHANAHPSPSARARRCIVAGTLLLTGVAQVCVARSAERPTLCNRLGGPGCLAQIADELVEGLRTDPVSAHHFAMVKLKRLNQQLGLQLCAVTDGPCCYDGDDMKEVHASQGIDQADFYRMVERLRRILDAHGVDTLEKNELLARLAPKKRDVATK